VADHLDRRLIVGGDNGAVRIVDDRGAVLETLSGSGSPVYSVAFSPDDQVVAAGRGDGTVTLWGPQRVPTTITTGGGVNAVAFSPDGRLVASADDSGSVYLTDLQGTVVAVLRGHAGAAKAVRFRPDGQQLISGGTDGTLRVWDVHTAGLLLTVAAADGPADSVDVSPDGATMLKSSEDGLSLRLLSCEVCGPLDAVVALAREHAFRRLTPDEERRFIS